MSLRRQLFKQKTVNDGNMRKCMVSALAVLATAGAISSPSLASSEPEGIEPDRLSISEIIVTARKREESLQDTPVSVTAFSSMDLNMRNMDNLSDIDRHTPNLIFDTAPAASGSSSGATVFIRGIGQLDPSLVFDPGVGIYIDGVYIPRLLGNASDIVDLERIEVLRGPQGTLFGRNSVGGAINIVTAKPSGEFEGSGELTVGRYNRRDFRGHVNFGLVPGQLAGKISVSIRDDDGYGRRPDALEGIGDRTGNTDARTVRAQLLWTPSDAVDVLFSFDDTRRREASAQQSAADINPDAPVAALWNALVAPGLEAPYDRRWLTDDPFVSLGTFPTRGDVDNWGTSVTVDWRPGPIDVKSISAYRTLDVGYGHDGDHSPLPLFDVRGDDSYEQFSQELQFSGEHLDDRLNWLVGLYYFHEDSSSYTSSIFMSGLFDAIEALDPGNPANVGLDLDIDEYAEVETNSYAAFSQATYNITDKLSFTGGLRYSYEKKKYFTVQTRRASETFAAPPSNEQGDWSALTPKAGLEYQWTDALMTYGTVSRGFKSGGFDATTLGTGDILTFDPEYVWSYEAGVKSEWFDRRLVVNAAAFYNDYSDIQLSSSQPTPDGNIDTVIENAGKARIQGFEVELSAVPAAGLTLSAGIGYIDAKFTELNPGASVTLDSKFQKTPDWTGNLGAQYDTPVGNYGTLSLRGDLTYRSKYYNDVNNSELLAQGELALIDARVAFQHSSGDWEVFAFGTNLTDKRYLESGISGIDSIGFALAFYGRPREWGAGFKYNF